MADDIVERLRNGPHGTGWSCDFADEQEIINAAADEIERLRGALLKYGVRSHYECEDCWYSCPRSADGCCDDRQGDKCNCGADEHNAEVEAIAMQEARRG